MHRRSPSLCLLAILAAAWPAAATTLVRMSLDELARAAGLVVRARCVSTESRWENGEIWTLATFEVSEALKGVPATRVQVRLLGGQVGHFKSTVDGVPRFQAGEEAYLFLEQAPQGDYFVTSWVQGTFRIRRDARTRQETVTQDTSGLAVFDPTTRQFRPGGVRRLPVEEFRQLVRDAVARAERGRQP